MSFARDCKDEICQTYNLSQSEEQVCLEAFLRLSSSIIIRDNQYIISFETANSNVCKRFLKIIKSLYKLETNLVMRRRQISKEPLYIAEVLDPEVILDDINLLEDIKNKDEILENELLKKAFLRASFLAKGSLNDPLSSDYHLEISTKDSNLSIFIQHLMNDFDLNSRISKRREEYVIYLKEYSKIIDFMRIIGISKNAFLYENEMIKRSVKSDIARKVNCEIANEVKALEASREQLKYITYIEYNYPLQDLDPKILLVMKVRKEHKEATFKELIQILNDEYNEKITKSGLNHRFIKIKELAKKLYEENERDIEDEQRKIN